MSATLAVVPARGGSKGLPRKNVRPLGGLPLFVHSLRLADLCPEIARTVVSTDDAEIAEIARAAGAEVLDRPAALAGDETPMLPVLTHAMSAVERAFDLLLLLDPTSPGRLPADVAKAHELLAANPAADGVVAVSEPSFNPLWQGVVVRDGRLELLFAEGGRLGRRQDAPRVLRINAALYLFRTAFLARCSAWQEGSHLPLEIPEERAFHIDNEHDFRLCELALEAGLVQLPWL